MGLGSSPIRLRATTDVKLFEESKQKCQHCSVTIRCIIFQYLATVNNAKSINY